MTVSLKLSILLWAMIHWGLPLAQEATGAIDAKTFDILTDVQTLAENDQYDQALEILNKLQKKDILSSYAKSQMWNFYAFIYVRQEHYQQAINSYQNILAETETPEGLRLNTQYALAQLYLKIEDYHSVIDLMEAWVNNTQTPTITAHLVLSQAYYQISNYAMSIQHINQAIKLNPKDKPIPESWFHIKLGSYHAKQDLNNMLATYQTLIQHHPKLKYLQQLSGLYDRLKQTDKLLAITDAIYLNGDITGAELLNLSYTYIDAGIPYKAGSILESAMQQSLIKTDRINITTLANAWLQAHEYQKAIKALQQELALSEQGKLYVLLANIHFSIANYEQAVLAAQTAEQKGNLENRGSNLMILGIALFHLEKYSKALAIFRQAKSFEQYFTNARKWEQHTLQALKQLKLLDNNKLLP